MRSATFRFLNLGLGLVGALLVGGCQSRPTPAPQPQPEATSLFVRNFTGHDVSIYAVPRSDAKPVWLTNVPADGSRSVSLRWSDLQANGGLVVRTQIVGSSNVWTSQALIIDDGIVGVLDLKLGASLTTANSELRGVLTQVFNAAMR
jgi:hypothetical protein